eukprot:749407-Hanusia_phi.AAC.2
MIRIRDPGPGRVGPGHSESDTWRLGIGHMEARTLKRPRLRELRRVGPGRFGVSPEPVKHLSLARPAECPVLL